MSKQIRILILLLSVMLLASSNIVFAQTPDEPLPPDDGESTAWLHLGARSQANKLIYTVGVGKELGSGFLILETVDFGYYGSLNSELAYIIKPTGWLGIGPIAGPDVDWSSPGKDGGELITYLVGAAGGMVQLKFGSFGAYGWSKYKFNPNKETSYIDDWYYGGGLLINL